MTRNIYRLIFILTLIILMCSPGIKAQGKGDNFRDKIEKIKMEKLIQKLELDNNTAELFKTKYKDFSAKVKELNQKRVIVYKLMVENLESGSGLDTLVSQLLDYESQLNTARENFAEELKTILTPKQVAIMIVFERKFNTELKKILKDYQKNKIQNN